MIAKHIPEWTDKDIEIIKDYEKAKKEGTLKEYVLIEKSDTDIEIIKERFKKILSGEAATIN